MSTSPRRPIDEAVAIDDALTLAPSGANGWWHDARTGWMGWRLRALAITALLGCIGLFVLLRSLAQGPHLDVNFRVDGHAGVELVGSGHTELKSHLRRTLKVIDAGTADRIQVDALLMHRAPRWAVDDRERQRILAQQSLLADLMGHPILVLGFDDGSAAQVRPLARGFSGLGTTFWLLSSLALVLYLIAAVVFLSRPGVKNLLYSIMAGCQAFNLLLMAVESLHGWGLPRGFVGADLSLRTLSDVVTGAAILQACLRHPHALKRGPWLATAGWVVALGYGLLSSTAGLPYQWWWTQSLLIGYGVASLIALTWSHHKEPHPVSLVLRRLGVAATSTLVLLTLVIALADRHGPAQYLIASIGSVIWYVFFASLLLLVPFLSRTQHVMREFAMLAGLSTVATSLDLLFITVFALGQFASLTLALFVSIAVYAGARQWIMNHLTGTDAVSVERTFESLYRAARAVETSPQQSLDHVGRLLLDLFEPLEVRRLGRSTSRTIVAANGSMLVVPVPQFAHLPIERTEVQGTFVLRYARRGRRLFTIEDARLADRVVEQLRSAVAFDRAVEQGRSEERARLAQDLHDDIGARLLTLMYKAPDPEMEEYLRHTLQDLKTLTRGLAARDHLLTDAAAEWKADITQRLGASHCDLNWAFDVDIDVRLNVVQWSGLTRILRELVSNVIAHANASRLDIEATFERGALRLLVSDDGQGRAPKAWSHGLGLGGVRKRARLLGGQVHWHEREPRGIQCEVRIPRLGDALK